MDVSSDAILSALYAAADATNEQELNDPIVKHPSTRLWGPSSVLDSLGLVSYLAAAEQELAARTGVELRLFDSKAMRQGANPYESIDSLCQYVQQLLAGNEPSRQMTRDASCR